MTISVITTLGIQGCFFFGLGRILIFYVHKSSVINKLTSAVSAQLWDPPKCLQGPPWWWFIKTFSTLCYISRPNGLQNKKPEWPSKPYLQTQVWQNQARSQVLRFGENTFSGGKIFIFIICLKQIFLSTTKFREAHKGFGVIVPA